MYPVERSTLILFLAFLDQFSNHIPTCQKSSTFSKETACMLSPIRNDFDEQFIVSAPK